MLKACDLKKGMAINVSGQLCLVRDIEVKSPSARGAATLYKVKFTNVQNGQKVEMSYKGDDGLVEAGLVKRPVQYSYLEGDTYYFMDTENYEQYGLNKDIINDQLMFLREGLEGIVAMLVDGAIIGIELPASVELEITDTTPAIKGASVTNRTKTAVLATGFEVQVPEYLANGDRIKVNTGSGKYMSRA